MTHDPHQTQILSHHMIVKNDWSINCTETIITIMMVRNEEMFARNTKTKLIERI